MKRALPSTENEEIEKYMVQYRKNVKRKLVLDSISPYLDGLVNVYKVYGRVAKTVMGYGNYSFEDKFKNYITSDTRFKSQTIEEREFVLLYDIVNLFVGSPELGLTITLGNLLAFKFWRRNPIDILILLDSNTSIKLPTEIITIILVQYVIQELVQWLHPLKQDY